MQIKVSYPSKTEAILNVVASESELAAIKTHVLSHFQGNAKVPGFRAGKVPAAVLEKHLDQNHLQTEFIQEAVDQLYDQALKAQKIRPIGPPAIQILKFVPYSTLEFEAKTAIVGEIKLADYKHIKMPSREPKVLTQDVQQILESLRTRLAKHSDVDRPAQNGDQVWIDFSGVDSDGKPINGADGKDYPLTLGSKTFIPGFEENLFGLGANDQKTFNLTFPKDYSVAALANKKVTFTVNITKVQSVELPKLDDALAAQAGPFKTLAELKVDIKKQLLIERQNEAKRALESELIKKITDKSTVEAPEPLVNDTIDRLLQELRQNLNYRGQTFPEFLKAESTTEEKYKNEVLKPQAVERVKASLVLGQIAEEEKIQITAEELEIRMQILKDQYKDPEMQLELDKPEARQDIASRLITEKTLQKLITYAT